MDRSVRRLDRSVRRFDRSIQGVDIILLIGFDLTHSPYKRFLLPSSSGEVCKGFRGRKSVRLRGLGVMRVRSKIEVGLLLKKEAVELVGAW